MLPQHPEHLRTFSYLGPWRYSLCFCTHHRQTRFCPPDQVALPRAQILRAAREHGFAVISYCFMPDHLHLLVHGLTDRSDLTAFASRAKQYSGFHYHQKFQHRLCQRYGYERVLRDREPTFVVARYILENPIRAGLVSHIEDYEFIGSSCYPLEVLIESVYAAERSG